MTPTLAQVVDAAPAAAAEALRGRGFARPEAALENLRRLSGIEGTDAALAALDEALPRLADPDRALNNLERYAEASGGELAPGPLARDRPELFGLGLRLFGFSQFVADLLARDPPCLAWIEGELRAGAPAELDALSAELRARLAGHDSPEARRTAAARWNRRRLALAAARALATPCDEARLMREVSHLAIASIRAGLEEVTGPLEARFGRPIEEDDEGGLSDREARFAVIAMGKLGGLELNFSSDIDLIFVYSAEGRTTGVIDVEGGPARGRLSNHDYFVRLSEGLTAYLSGVTPEGSFYRVDTRLRPDGAEGPLARSLTAFEIYHETQARPWERLALVRGWAVAGDAELRATVNRLIRSLAYGSRPGPGFAGQVRRMKTRIDAKVAERGIAGREIKRGPGGIREIEFLVQTLQLMHGAGRADLQATSTLGAIDRLGGAGHLAAGEARALREDYLDLRIIENRLQLLELRQTHTLPDRPAELDALARRCGFEARCVGAPGALLTERWREISQRVHAAFVTALPAPEDAEGAEENRSPASRAAGLLIAEASESELIPLLKPFGLESAGAIRGLRRLGGRGGAFYLDAGARERYETLAPRILEGAGASARPEAALAHLESFLEASGSIGAMYEIFEANPKLLELLLAAFGLASSWARTLIAHPEYIDHLLQLERFGAAPTAGQSRERIERWAPADAPEDRFAAGLARFRRFEFLMTGLAETAGLTDFDGALERLTDAADAVVRAAVGDAVARVLGEAPGEAPIPFAVMAMGKMGTRELTYVSDLDLIFVWDDSGGGATPLSTDRASQVAARCLASITAMTPEGRAFTADARLRPEGGNAPLAPTLSRYLDYYRHRAGIWEFQSLMKMRWVAGDEGLGRRLLSELRAIASQRVGALESDGGLAAEIAQMRRRIEASARTPGWALCDLKKGPGGLVDLEFLAQYFQLRALADGSDWIGMAADKAFARAAAAGAIEPEESRAMIEDYRLLRRFETRVRLLFETDRSLVPAGGEKWAACERAASGVMPDGTRHLRDRLLLTLRRNRSRFDRHMRS